ncbi:DHHC palmitoyltransferase-domain-containing protein [Schizophyllum amplum]|uniref:Palmitoyltransferase n=1 Tax=Schizophyllum amplum TaxID=97359 RepID=A0A550CZU1_9AGAR|nr:DHHC palmitoyltransferase-domain-containing protein [Auriculariopsis ampla]
MDPPVRRWYHYVPISMTVALMLAPHPSLLHILVRYHLQTRGQPLAFGVHLLATYTLTFMAFSSLIICVSRDPGPVSLQDANTTSPQRGRADEDDTDEIELTESLISVDYNAPGRWCNKCWSPKPERTHHCSECNRCVLKMDHHCPWLASRCVGHRTYPAFVHFLISVTILATYIAVICVNALLFAFRNPYSVDDITPIHEISLAFYGIVITIVIGSFLCYHLYLISTNQTTIENLSPFLLLRHLPVLPSHAGDRLSNPPVEAELSYSQRNLVRDAHNVIRLYDVGWRKNWAQVFGWKGRFGWTKRLLCGGVTTGSGKYFPRNPKADDMLARLAEELVKAEKDR